MERFDYLIVGGGLGAASAVDGIRERDPHGTICILADEGEPPYHRPPLSKEYLRTPAAGRDMLHVKPQGWFESEAGVTLRTGVRATLLDPRERIVTTAGGEQMGGERLLLATGGRPRRPVVPGSDLERVFTLRTVEDSEAIRGAARQAEHALLVGAGFIGMELAASLVEMEVAPLVVEVQERVWTALLPPPLSDFVRSYFEERGATFRLGTEVRELRGGDRVERAALSDDTEVPCDLVVIGVGIDPNQELAAEAGLAVHDGIVVDRYGETSHGHIYATGDVARFPDPVFGDSCRVEHWDHAKTHGRFVGRNMAGDREAYDHLSYFFSDVFDLSLNVFGRPALADRVLVRGQIGAGKAVVFCAAEGRLCGSIAINAPDTLEECRELVRRRTPLEDLEGEAGNSASELGELVG